MKLNWHGRELEIRVKSNRIECFLGYDHNRHSRIVKEVEVEGEILMKVGEPFEVEITTDSDTYTTNYMINKIEVTMNSIIGTEIETLKTNELLAPLVMKGINPSIWNSTLINIYTDCMGIPDNEKRDGELYLLNRYTSCKESEVLDQKIKALPNFEDFYDKGNQRIYILKILMEHIVDFEALTGNRVSFTKAYTDKVSKLTSGCSIGEVFELINSNKISVASTREGVAADYGIPLEEVPFNVNFSEAIKHSNNKLLLNLNTGFPQS